MRLCLLAALGLFGLGALLYGFGRVDGYRVEHWTGTEPGQPDLSGRFYLPEETSEKLPGVLLCHGANNSKETMTLLALEFVRHGYVVLAFDFGGHGESAPQPASDAARLAEVQRAAAALAQHVAVDGQRLIFGGHSLGARVAAGVAWEQDRVRATVSLGMIFPAQTDRPRNLLLGAGFYDQLHSPAAMQAALQTAVGDAQAEAGTHYGDFATGTARALTYSAQVDHVLEPFDSTLIASSVAWANASLAKRPTAGQPRAHWLPIAWTANVLGTVCLALAVWQAALGRFGWERLREPGWRRGSALVGAALCLIPVASSRFIPALDYWWADLSLAMFLTLMLNNLLWRLQVHAATGPGAVLPWVLSFFGQMVVLAGSAWLGAMLLLRLPAACERLEVIWDLPGLLLKQPLYLLSYALMKLRLLLFSSYSTHVTPSWILLGLLLFEVASPGTLLILLAQGTQRLVCLLRWQGSPAPTSQPAVEDNSPLAGRLLASVLLVVALVVLWQLVQLAGVNWSLVLVLGQIAFAFGLLPLVVLCVLINCTSLGRLGNSPPENWGRVTL
ncbi:MAG: alpha/beta fold hydrolase [Planctomycetia bacterium]|nr:alpha/beta fold hydrolase [Planctomycetia bacterium]